MSTQPRLQALDRRVAGLEALQVERVRRAADLVSECEAIEKRLNLLTKVEQVLQLLTTKTVAASTAHTDKLVTVGLKAVFHDLNLEFRTKIGKARGKTSAEFQLLQDGRAFPINESYGGGVLAMTGVLLRVTTITALKLRRVLVLDESLAHLSEAYHDTASELMRSLCEKLGFTVLMVTHAEGFAQAADRHYHARKDSSGALYLELKKG